MTNVIGLAGVGVVVIAGALLWLRMRVAPAEAVVHLSDMPAVLQATISAAKDGAFAV